MNTPLIPRTDLLAGLPPAPSITTAEVAAAQSAASHAPIHIVLDDDPTGTQSVAGLPVLTSWQIDDFTWALGTGAPAVYVMTNSRSLSPENAEGITREVVAAALESARGLGVEIDFVSRSDSTLRGHYPLETDTIADALKSATGRGADGVLLVPAFPEAGRITVRGVHYAGSADHGYLPAAESEFAEDNTFGYSRSSLAEWVEEKTGGARRADDVLLIDIETLRTDPDRTVDILTSAKKSTPIAVDAVVHGVIERTTPRFVAAKGGITSSDAASKGLEIRRARVIGPMLPGIVSLWSAIDGTAAGIPYIVFAGNVGTDESLAEVVAKLEL